MPNQASRSLMPLVAGNWKMNGVRANLPEIAQIRDQIGDCTVGGLVQVLICPPATLVAAIAEMAGDHLLIGGQDCHTSEAGAHTGDISAAMLRDAGASAVIVGHSERRTDHAETDGIVHAKTTAAHQAGLLAIICVGETSAQRTAGTTLDIIAQQLAGSVPDGAAGHNTVVAYEPVWAIGTGLTPTSADVAEVHAFMRAKLCARFGAEGGQLRLLYGGSVKPSNATALLALPDVNGALVGGASLKAVDFLGIIAAYRR